MKRLLICGDYRDSIARASTCCTGECNQGRQCPLTIDRVCRGVARAEPVRQRPVIGAQLEPGSWVRVQPAIERFDVAWWRRVRRALKAFWRFLRSPRWLP